MFERITCFTAYRAASVWAHDIELEDRGPETLPKVPDKLISPHPDMEETSNALPPLDRAHILSDELLKWASERGYRTGS